MIKSRVREMMEEKGITVLDLSMETGLATETITRARGDKIQVCRLDTLEALAQALGVKVKDLFSEND